MSSIPQETESNRHPCLVNRPQGLHQADRRAADRLSGFHLLAEASDEALQEVALRLNGTAMRQGQPNLPVM